MTTDKFDASGSEQARPRHPACPSWCLGDHDVGEHDGVLRHVSHGVLVPGIALVARAGRQRSQPVGDAHDTGTEIMGIGLSDGLIELSGGDHAVGITLTVALHQRSDSPLTWVYVGDGERMGFDISSETAWLLAQGMRVVLEGLE